MKTAVVYYSLTGKTYKLVNTINNTIKADIIEIQEIHNRSKINALLLGSFDSHFRRCSNTFPLNIDIDDYENIIIATPVWAGGITPAICSFIRGYNLKDKNINGIICYGSNCKNAEQILKEELQNSKANLKNILKIKYDKILLEDLQLGLKMFEFDEENKLLIKSKENNVFLNNVNKK